MAKRGKPLRRILVGVARVAATSAWRQVEVFTPVFMPPERVLRLLGT